jgi:hypothetical protein
MPRPGQIPIAGRRRSGALSARGVGGDERGNDALSFPDEPAKTSSGDFTPCSRQVNDRCEFIVSEVLAFPADEPFDIVIANDFFDYIADPAAVLRHLHSLNRGKLIATFPLYTALRVPFRKLWRMGQRCYVRFYTRRGIIAACEAAGYRVERLERHGPTALLVASATPLSSSAA